MLLADSVAGAADKVITPLIGVIRSNFKDWREPEKRRKIRLQVHGRLRKDSIRVAWKLVPTDKTPTGKRDDISLREKVKEILRDLNDGIDTIGKKMTVCQLYARQNSIGRMSSGALRRVGNT